MKKLPLFALALSTFAQFEQGSIVGTVTDPQKAPIANATVQIRSTSIGFAGAARITSAGSPTVYQRTSRQIQLALKLYF